MLVVRARNVNDALTKGLSLLTDVGIKRDSRAGPVLVAPEPVTTVYERPLEKVVYSQRRDANPFFHLFEGLWMLAGRDDVAWLSQFNSKIGDIASDDGKTFHGAYGPRWRTHFGFDQLWVIAHALEQDPKDRRQILQMWDPKLDLGRKHGKDLPCNTCCHFQRGDGGELNLTVFCRSNDLVWGVTGSDSVDFSMLLELMAAMIGCKAGRYWQVSDNYHGYLATIKPLFDMPPEFDIYEQNFASSWPMVSVPARVWLMDLAIFMQDVEGGMAYCDPFFERTAAPLLRAWRHHKNRDYDKAFKEIDRTRDADWAYACRQWLQRRESKWSTS